MTTARGRPNHGKAKPSNNKRQYREPVAVHQTRSGKTCFQLEPPCIINWGKDLGGPAARRCRAPASWWQRAKWRCYEWFLVNGSLPSGDDCRHIVVVHATSAQHIVVVHAVAILYTIFDKQWMRMSRTIMDLVIADAIGVVWICIFCMFFTRLRPKIVKFQHMASLLASRAVCLKPGNSRLLAHQIKDQPIKGTLSSFRTYCHFTLLSTHNHSKWFGDQ